MRAAAMAYADCAKTQEWHIALTLDFESGISRGEAERVAKHFWQKVDSAAFGNGQVKRQGKRLKRICFWHGDDNEGRNWHLHAAVKLERLTDDWRTQEAMRKRAVLFAEGLRLYWLELKGAGQYCKSELVRDNAAWLHYIRKEEHYSCTSFAAEISTQFA